MSATESPSTGAPTVDRSATARLPSADRSAEGGDAQQKPPEGPGCFAMLALFLGLGAVALAGIEYWQARWAWPVDPSWYRVEEADGKVTFGCQNYAPVRFDADPADGVTRIVLLGGSAAFGFPDRPVGETPIAHAAHGIGGAMQASLDSAWPGRFEVVNLGVNGGTSEDTLRLARRAMVWHPNALVVYDGNNEFMDVPRHMSPTLWRFALYRRATVMAERADAAPGWVGPPAWSTAEAAGAVHARLERDLVAVADLARDGGVPVVFATQAANLADFDPSWSTAGDEATLRSLATRSDPEVEALWAATPDSADLAWAVGQRRLAVGHDARAALQAAVDHDGVAFRPTTAVNDTIRAAARESGAALAEAEGALGDAPPGGDAFYDWVHPRPEAATAIASIILGHLQATKVIPGAAEAVEAPPLPEAEAAARDVRVAVSWLQWSCLRAHDPGFRLTHAESLAQDALAVEPSNPMALGILAVTPLLRDPAATLANPLPDAVRTKLSGVHRCVRERLGG